MKWRSFFGGEGKIWEEDFEKKKRKGLESLQLVTACGERFLLFFFSEEMCELMSLVCDLQRSGYRVCGHQEIGVQKWGLTIQ